VGIKNTSKTFFAKTVPSSLFKITSPYFIKTLTLHAMIETLSFNYKKYTFLTILERKVFME
jgi:hypothetical protein